MLMHVFCACLCNAGGVMKREKGSEGGAASASPRAELPLLVDIKQLSVLLSRSAASLERDAAAGRLPPAVRLGGSRRWRLSEIVRWVDAGCPDVDRWRSMKGGVEES